MIEVPMTDAQFAAAAERLKGYGVELTGPSGTLSHSGVTARYQYGDGRLAVEVVDKPFFMPTGAIESRLKSAIEQALEQAQT